MMPRFPSRRWLKAVLIIVWCWPTFPLCFASRDIAFKVYLQTGESDKVVLKKTSGAEHMARRGGWPHSKANPAEKMKKGRIKGEERRVEGGGG